MLGRKTIVAAIILDFASPATAGPFEDGLDAYANRQYATALEMFRPLADQGDAPAQLKLGLMYDHGHGVSQNNAEALKWYRSAADQGYAAAQVNVGLMYRFGQGVPPD